MRRIAPTTKPYLLILAILMKDSKGCVSAKYVRLPIYGAKKNAIWVPKTLVTNIQGPKKIWVPKRVRSLL